MKKYAFMMTGNDVWLKVAIELHKNNVAEPVFWLGDDSHLIKAKKIFGEKVHSLSDFVHYQSNINNNYYRSEFIEFFKSTNYLRAKDRCLKMMDRLDSYGLFNRLDREVVFNKLCIWILKEISQRKPEYLVMSEFAHSHAQYLVYEICDFLGLKIAKFNDWGSITPMIFMQEVKTGKRYPIFFNYPTKIKSLLLRDIENHIKTISNRKNNDNYIPNYIKKQWNINFKEFFQKIIYEFKSMFFQMRKMFSVNYYQINPCKLDLFQLNLISRRRAKYLKKNCSKNSDKPFFGKKFVYFAMHFEPERTTNPDGGFFHDQFLALLYLRKMLPEDVSIFVKEHPTQFKLIKRGIKGRSPLFYDLIKGIDKVVLIDIETDTYSLTKSSLFVATITGTAAREAAIMGKKALIFGDAWFNKCPNVFSWSEGLTFEQIMEQQLCNKEEILKYLINQMQEYSVPACQNPSSQKIFKNYLNKDFYKAEFNGIYELMKIFLDD